MKLITDKSRNGLTNPEFTEYLKTPVEKSEFTKEEAEELENAILEGLKKYPGIGLSETK